MMRLHHVGIVVTDIEAHLSQSLYELKSSVVTDHIQGARLCMVGLPGDEVPMIELIQPINDASRTYQALARGQAYHHMCFCVPSREAADALIREKRLLPVTDWEPADLFGGRVVRFAYSRNRELLEFLVDEVRSSEN